MDPSIDDSDVSMPVETDDEDDDFYGSTPKEHNSEGRSGEAETEAEGSKKRKFSTSSDTPNGQLEREVEDRKRQRSNGNMQVQGTSSPRDKSLLPAEIWHHVFTFCPPRVLGILLRVNQAFNAYLDPSSSDPSVNPLPRSALKLLSADTIWAASRRLFPLPGMQTMPAPLLGKSELQMWKMVCGSLCQFCFKKGKVAASVDKWHPGPGENGVSPILSLGIRSCGACLQQNSTKEIDLLLSSSIPSPLMAALPFVFLTNELHAISSTTLQTGQQPPSIQITKHYYNPRIEEIKHEFEDVKSLGSATAEEWLKGLDGRGREHRDDAARWERWEAAGGLSKMRESRTDGSHKKNTTTTPTIPNYTQPLNGSSPIAYNGISSLSQPPHVQTNTASHPPQPLHNNFAIKPPLRFDSPQQNGFSFPPRPHPQAKHERTKEEVAELKAARRAEIERRCLLLNPPIEAGVLAHMASFQAAIQIIQPLTDSAWEVLKPRLLSQREEAEQRENDRIAQTRVQERFDERRFQDLQAKGDPKDLVDKEWEDMQAPLRARIGGYADEIIRDGWNNGEKVSLDTSPLFAAEVLIYVRKRFYAEIAKDEAAVRATGREPEIDPPHGPYTRRLTLENMKWVFDTKVKPHTEQYRKELFLCNACDHASKYYGFEGVIQHFAAKHTSALSSGSVVVHWKSEWPEYPPFNPDPAAASVNSYYPAAPSASVPYAVSNGQGTVQNYGYGGYQAAPLPAPMQTPNPHGYQESPGPYYGHPQFGDQYPSHQNGPFAPPPPQAYPDTSQAYHTPQYSLAPAASNVSGYHGISHDYNQQTFDGQYQPQSQSMYTSPHNRITYPATGPETSVQPVYTQQAGQYSNNYTQPSPYAASNFPQVPQRSGEYTAQLLDLARNAREVWNSIGGLKEVPGSVKVYTIIYHILARFRATFQDDPPFSMLVEGLSSNKDMRPVRNVNGLLCKACSLGMAGASSAPQKKHFSFPQLVNHFHTLHDQELSQPSIGHPPDWKTDMVLLPDISKLTSIVNATGMDDKKLRFFTEALPEIVAVPEPSVHNYHNGSSHYFGGATDSNGYAHLAPSQDNHEKYYTTVDSAKPSETGSITYDSGEYDPRHPAELPTVAQPQHRTSRQREQQPESSQSKASWQYARHQDQAYRESYQDRSSRTYIEHSPPHAISVDDYGHAPPEARRLYVDEPVRYRDAGDVVAYRVRREPRIVAYQEPERIPSKHRFANDQSYQNNSAEVATDATFGYPVRDQYSGQANSTQQDRIYEVVAQISQHAQQARERVPAKIEAGETGSEDGEVRAEIASKPDPGRKPPSEEASNAAERFLNEFRPGEVANDAVPQETSNGSRRAWDNDRPSSKQVHHLPMDSHRRGAREVYGDDERVLNNDQRVSPTIHDEVLNGYERALPPRRNYVHDERYAGSAEGQPLHRDRSPELVDRRYKVNNVVYRDERQGSHGMHRTPSSRYARYESVRLENDRARSRSPPVYVKIGPQSGQYRERSPVAHPLRQESAYRTRTPVQHVEDDAFERPRRQEYTRVYVEEHRPRETRYAEGYELIRVSDPDGDYMIRRPVRREVEREPVYADYEDEVYARPPIYENRAPVARAEPAFVEEEYDPRQPAAVPVPVARYQ